MPQARPSGRGWSRRCFLASCSLLRLPAAPVSGALFPPETHRYLDSATEFPVVRLTDPEHSCLLPNPLCRFISSRQNFLLYSSDRTGSMQAFRLDLKSGQNTLLTDAAALDASSLTLFPNEKDLAYIDGRVLFRANLRNRKKREVYHIPEGWDRAADFSLAANGKHATFVELSPAASRLRVLDMGSGKASTVLQMTGAIRGPAPRPKSSTILYGGPDGALYTIDYDGRNNLKLPTAAGRAGTAVWASDGKLILYLNFPPGPGALTTLRELSQETGEDKLIAKTSQFVGFGPNGNGSVFVGASANKAGPHILLLVRLGGRELTLCEHRAADPWNVKPVFSPDSRIIFFESDRDGKPAIYSMPVTNLVERTES